MAVGVRARLKTLGRGGCDSIGTMRQQPRNRPAVGTTFCFNGRVTVVGPSRRNLNFRRLERGDLELLARWLLAPHVATWWREDADLVVLEARYAPVMDGSDPTEVFVVAHEDLPIGLIQRYRVSNYPDWQRVLSVVTTNGLAAGMDYLIGVERFTGRGVGSEMISQFVTETWTQWPEISSVVVSVQQQNVASWRALEKAGFARVWSGTLDSTDPSDGGPSFIYLSRRPLGAPRAS